MIKQVNILGVDVYVTFCLATQIAFEELTDRPFDTDGLKLAKNLFALYCAAITSCRKNEGLPDDFADKILTEASAAEVVQLDKAVTECLSHFYHIPAQAKDDATQEAESQKN